MVKVHKRKKTSRLRGSKTGGWGFRQKHKGHGNKGGVGMAGSGKRADHKKQKAKEMDKKKTYFGKQGLTSRSTKKKKELKINLRDIQANHAGSDIDLSKYTILGTGEGFKAKIKAKHASKGAIEKMKAAGGEIILPQPKAEEAPKKEAQEKPMKEEAKATKETSE
jgi:large subunit ribosomal protein L15